MVPVVSRFRNNRMTECPALRGAVGDRRHPATGAPSHRRPGAARRRIAVAVAVLALVPAACADDADDAPVRRSILGAGLHYVTDVAIVVPDSLTRVPFPSHVAGGLSALATRTPRRQMPAVLELTIGEDDDPTDDRLGVAVRLIDRRSGRPLEREVLGSIEDPLTGGTDRRRGGSLLADIWNFITFSDDPPAGSLRGGGPSEQQSRRLAASLVARLDTRFLKPLALHLGPDRTIRVITQSEIAAAERRAGLGPGRAGSMSPGRMLPGQRTAAAADRLGADPVAVGSLFGRRPPDPVARSGAVRLPQLIPVEIITDRPLQPLTLPARSGADAAGFPSGNGPIAGSVATAMAPGTPGAGAVLAGPTPEEAAAAVYFGHYDNLLDAELFLETARAAGAGVLDGTTSVIRRSENPDTGPRYRLFALTRTADGARRRCRDLKAAGTDCQGVEWPVN